MPGVKRGALTVSTSVRDPKTGRFGPPRARTKSAKGRKRARNAIVRVPRTKLAFPQGMRSTLRYVERQDFNVSSVDQIITSKLLANGMYDPNTALGGHQPRGFDEFMNLYQTFTVLGSKISVNWVYTGYDGPSTLDSVVGGYMVKSTTNLTADQPSCCPVIVGIHKGTEDLPAGTAAQTMELDRTNWRAMTPSDGAVTMSNSLAVSDFFGKGTLVGAEGYTGTRSADPAEQIFWQIWVGRANAQSSGTCQVVAYITVEYDAMFTEPKGLGAS